MHSTHIFAFPELVCYIVSFLPAAHDTSHLSQCCSYLHELVLPMLYEDVAISFTSVAVILIQRISRPNLSQRCHTLWMKDPTIVTNMEDSSRLFGACLLYTLAPPYDPVTVWGSLRCAARGLEIIDISAPYVPNFQVGDPTKLATFTLEIKNILAVFTVGVNAQGRLFDASVLAPPVSLSPPIWHNSRRKYQHAGSRRAIS
ncbi:hypothetical protein BS47DRAFT_1398438 [Hydnum rufescens UP504]|uniref:Uncharacterized protein n=1 Tax=Hydnum rufescens UP504 TaxID=1448309 RepID=A0A9P6AKX2_9AGAM|nr:hypothetical protein BS47DRAFT_1398438 [Hydnum rufescens UP504]